MTQEDASTHTTAAEQPTSETDAVGGSYSSSSAGQSPLDAHVAAASQSGDRPEILVGAAFVGGIVLAQILKRFGGDDD